jgi:hypothetical protein
LGLLHRTGLFWQNWMSPFGDLDVGGTQRAGLFWQNWAYPAGRATLSAFEAAPPSPGAGAVCCGSTAAEIGVTGSLWVCVAARERQWDERDGVEANDRIGARPWSALARADLARVLVTRDASADREEANNLLREALATNQLGMIVAARKITAEVR